jgi:hypothetical protein
MVGESSIIRKVRDAIGSALSTLITSQKVSFRVFGNPFTVGGHAIGVISRQME